MSGPKPDALPLGDTPMQLTNFFCLRGNYYSKDVWGFVNLFRKKIDFDFNYLAIKSLWIKQFVAYRSPQCDCKHLADDAQPMLAHHLMWCHSR